MVVATVVGRSIDDVRFPQYHGLPVTNADGDFLVRTCVRVILDTYRDSLDDPRPRIELQALAAMVVDGDGSRVGRHRCRGSDDHRQSEAVVFSVPAIASDGVHDSLLFPNCKHTRFS